MNTPRFAIVTRETNNHDLQETVEKFLLVRVNADGTADTLDPAGEWVSTKDRPLMPLLEALSSGEDADMLPSWVDPETDDIDETDDDGR